MFFCPFWSACLRTSGVYDLKAGEPLSSCGRIAISILELIACSPVCQHAQIACCVQSTKAKNKHLNPQRPDNPLIVKRELCFDVCGRKPRVLNCRSSTWATLSEASFTIQTDTEQIHDKCSADSSITTIFSLFVLSEKYSVYYHRKPKLRKYTSIWEAETVN